MILIRRTLILPLTISLILLAALPTVTMNSVHGVLQNGTTTWSPFGPREQKLTITSYGDFTAMFTAFQNGQVDITDWPLERAQLDPASGFGLCDSTHPDYFCTSPTSELGIFQLDIRHDQPFLGIPLQANRTAPQPSFVLPASAGSGCSTGFGQLTVHLQNLELGNAVILDSLNKLTISNQPSGSPSATVSDSGGSNPTGTYVFPCILSGTYKISSSVYGANSPCSTTAPTTCIIIGSSKSLTATLGVDWNSPSTRQPTQGGNYVVRALAHLLDKPSFVRGFWGNTATLDDEEVAPAQNVPNLFSNTAECSDHPWFNPCNPVSAYNFANDSTAGGGKWWTLNGQAIGVGLGYSGYGDLRAACDDFVKAGFSVVNGVNATDCGNVALASLGTSPPSTSAYPHLSNNGQQINFVIRTSAGRKQFGVIMADAINFLFGTPNDGRTFPTTVPCTVTYNFGAPGCNLRFPQPVQFLQCVFQDLCPWNLYTAGYGLTPFPDHLYAIYHSSFALKFCGGIEAVAQGYAVYCDPQFDTYASAGEFSPTLSQSIQFFARAAATGASGGMTIPVYSRIDQFAELNGWNIQQCNGTNCAAMQSSIVNTIGAGTQAGYWTLLNARQVPGYNPCAAAGAPSNCASYIPGGGDPTLIRRGFSQDTQFLSPFQASTLWEFEILSQIFDSMLQPNPLTGGIDGQIIDWGTTSHSSTFDAATGVTTQFWHLRNDLKFQDGNPVTANDVAYTITSYRDVPSLAFGSTTAPVLTAVGIDCGPGQPCKTLQVKLQGTSPFFELNIGTLPIIEKSLWAPVCGDPPSPTSQCANLAFDPMAAGLMVGSGPWNCIVPTGFANAGHIGGSCFVNADGTLGGQASAVGGQWFLTRNKLFDRCCPDDKSSSLYKLSWADVNNDGVVNILDLASAAVKFGQPDPYWVNTKIAPGSTVNIQDLATVAFYFGHGTTYPFRPSQLTGLDPQIDPFFCPSTGC